MLRCIVTLMVTVTLATSTSATLIVSNLGEVTTGDTAVQHGHWVANGFTVDGSSSYQINSISVPFTFTSSPGGNFGLMILNSSAGSPGSLVQVLAGSSNPNGGLFVFTGNALLQASQSYFLAGFVSSGGASYNWQSTSSTNQSGIWTISDTKFRSLNQGSTWEGGFANPLKFSIDATAVPEPTSITLVGLVTLASGASGRRKRQIVKSRSTVDSSLGTR